MIVIYPQSTRPDLTPIQWLLSDLSQGLVTDPRVNIFLALIRENIRRAEPDEFTIPRGYFQLIEEALSPMVAVNQRGARYIIGSTLAFRIASAAQAFNNMMGFERLEEQASLCVSMTLAYLHVDMPPLMRIRQRGC